MSPRHFLLMAAFLAVASCGGGGGGSSSGGEQEGNAGLFSCDTSANQLVGCWQSTCEYNFTNAGVDYYSQYTFNIRNTGTATHHIVTYGNSNCVGDPFMSITQPYTDAIAVGSSYTSSEGLTARYMAMRYTISGVEGDPRYTGYYRTNTSLCFAEGDYHWVGNTGGGFGNLHATTDEVPLSIDLNDCMTRKP